MWSGCISGEKAVASIGCLAYASIRFNVNKKRPEVKPQFPPYLRAPILSRSRRHPRPQYPANAHR